MQVCRKPHTTTKGKESKAAGLIERHRNGSTVDDAWVSDSVVAKVPHGERRLLVLHRRRDSCSLLLPH
jgi:hypothetical protein